MPSIDVPYNLIQIIDAKPYNECHIQIMSQSCVTDSNGIIIAIVVSSIVVLSLGSAVFVALYMRQLR